MQAVTSYPLVSICLPTYNDATFLHQSLASLVGQTYTNIEILLGDDASTDSTPVEAQAFTDTRIHYYRNEYNIGQFANVNAIIQRARGKYIAIYHSDDVYMPTIVEREVTFLEAYPQVGAVFALDHRIDTEGKLIGITKLPRGVVPNVPLTLDDLMPAFLRHRNRILRAPTFMGRAEVFQCLAGFRSDFDIAGDFEMWLRILTKYPIAIMDEHLLRYRRGASQVSSRYNQLRTFEEHFFVIIDEYLHKTGLVQRMEPADLLEYAFHRCDDETFRAANLVILGKREQANELLKRPFPWRAFRNGLTRRKIRVLLLRVIMRLGLTARAIGLLGKLLILTEYGGQIERDDTPAAR